MRVDLRKRFVIGSAITLLLLAIIMGIIITRYLEEQTLIQTGMLSGDFFSYLSRHVISSDDLVRPKSGHEYDTFDKLIHNHLFTKYLVSIKIYDSQEMLIYHSHAPDLVGRKFPSNSHLKRALKGDIVVHFSTLDGKEHLYERQTGYHRLQEIYLPIKDEKGHQVIGAFELYSAPTPLFRSISQMKFFVWALIILGLLGLNSNLYWIIRDASRSLRRQQEISRRNQELATLNAVGMAINESLDLDEILSRALDMILDVTQAESAEIFLMDDTSETLVQQKFRGRFIEAFQEITHFKPGEGFPGRIAQTGNVLVVRDLYANPDFLRERVKQAGFQAFAGVPLRSKGKIVGVMDIASLASERPTSEDVSLLSALGNQIGVAIENARLYSQLQEMSALEERQRIAREMHDGLAQHLGFLHFKLGNLEKRADLQLAPIQDEIQQMKQVTSDAYDEVRQAIFGLKMVSRSLGLIPALTEYLHTFGEQTGIAVELRILDERATHLSLEAEVQLIRIVQEALANVRKHANAQNAGVVFDIEGDKAKIIIMDDGKGFNHEEVACRNGMSFGLQTMKERVESVGGMSDVTSQPGQGSQVNVWLPLHI